MNRLLLILLTLSLQTFGQDTTTTRHKLFIGLNLSPDHCGRLITQNDKSISNATWSRDKALEDSIIRPKFGYTAGISFDYQINNWLSVETGLQFSNKGFKTIPILTIYNSSNPFGGFTEATNIISYEYLDIPLKAKFYFLKNRFQLLASIGATFNYLLRVTVKTIPTEETETNKTETNVDDYPYNKINISPTISFGAKYNLNDKLNLQLVPTFSYGLLKLNDKDYKVDHLWSLGANVIFYYRLK
jgi:hypothetical protein